MKTLRDFLEEIEWNENFYQIILWGKGTLASGTARELYDILGFYLMEHVEVITINEVVNEGTKVYQMFVDFTE